MPCIVGENILAPPPLKGLKIKEIKKRKIAEVKDNPPPGHLYS